MASDESVNMPELKEDSDIDDDDEDHRGENSTDGCAGHSIGMFALQLSIKRSFHGGLNQKQQLKELPIKGQASEKESQIINQKDFILYGQKKMSSSSGGRNNYNLGNRGFSFSFGGGDSEGEGGEGVVVITRPKGGRRSLFMDLDEVKACRELGFELEHEDKIIMPTRPRLSSSVSSGSTATLHTSSSPNSPIANWPISSPGDNPRDVKARLRVWAQAVALASTSRQS